MQKWWNVSWKIYILWSWKSGIFVLCSWTGLCQCPRGCWCPEQEAGPGLRADAGTPLGRPQPLLPAQPQLFDTKHLSRKSLLMQCSKHRLLHKRGEGMPRLQPAAAILHQSVNNHLPCKACAVSLGCACCWHISRMQHSKLQIQGGEKLQLRCTIQLQSSQPTQSY